MKKNIEECYSLTKRDIENELESIEKEGWLTRDEKKDFLNTFPKKINVKTPKKDYIFNAFKIGKEEDDDIIKPEDVNVLILGQDPYPENDKAHGLAFSVNNSYTKEHGIDDSLLNIFKAIKVYQDENIKYFNDVKKEDINWYTDLTQWAKNGVLLLNTALTHSGKDDKCIKTHRDAWESFIQQIISNLIKTKLNSNKNLAIFLWGDKAQTTFLRALNKSTIKYKANIHKLLKPKERVEQITYKNNRSRLKINSELIRAEISINIEDKTEIKLFMTSHPSNNHQSAEKGFKDDAPKHFQTCDEFLFGKDKKNYIWLNFPENNK